MITIENEDEPVEKIDLYNFEDPRYENSRYVLTSPRSLEACSRLNVKPVELLYKPLTEFQEELLPQDVPLRTIYNIYDEQEQIRQRKLQLCREERGRVSKEDIQDKSFGTRNKGDQGGNMSKASLQRQRTAWSSGIGHQRVTKDELNQRAKNLHDESAKLRKELLSRKEGKPRRPLSRRPGSARGTPRINTSPSHPTRSKSVSEIYSKLPAKDRKILDLMRAKREEEKLRLDESERTRLLWEDERLRQETLRTVMENKRRKLLARQNRIKDSKKLNESLRQSRAKEQWRDKKEEDILRQSKCSEQRLYRQLKSQELKLSEKKDKEMLRKSIQERNLEMQTHDEEEMMQRVAQHTKSILSQALYRKDVNIMQQSLRKSMTNHQERNAFELRRSELEKDARLREQGSHSVVELRHSKAEENLANLLETRNQQLISSHMEEEKKQEKARQVQQKLEEEMEQWRRSLLKHKLQVEKQAEVTAQVTKETRAQRARQDRQTREQEQHRNLKKLKKEHAKWKRSLESSLHEKDRKVEEIQLEREKSVMQMREMAQMSHMLRDKLRMKYEQDTFDRKVLDAQLFAKLETRPSTAKRSAKAS